jgi:hypothetical protein
MVSPNNIAVISEDAAIAPNFVTGPYEITEQMSESDLQLRRNNIISTFQDVESIS